MAVATMGCLALPQWPSMSRKNSLRKAYSLGLADVDADDLAAAASLMHTVAIPSAL